MRAISGTNGAKTEDVLDRRLEKTDVFPHFGVPWFFERVGTSSEHSLNREIVKLLTKIPSKSNAPVSIEHETDREKDESMARQSNLAEMAR